MSRRIRERRISSFLLPYLPPENGEKHAERLKFEQKMLHYKVKNETFPVCLHVRHPGNAVPVILKPGSVRANRTGNAASPWNNGKTV